MMAANEDDSRLTKRCCRPWSRRAVLVGLLMCLQLPTTSSEAPQHFPTQLSILRGPLDLDGRCAGGRPFAQGGFDAGQACPSVGSSSAGSCSGGTWIAVKGTCTNAQGNAYCRCSDAGVPECVNGIGEAGTVSCDCVAPNTDGRCMSNAGCTGGGSCSGYGVCAAANTGDQCSSTLECTGAGGEVAVGDGTQTELWPGASQTCIVQTSPANQSSGALFGGNPFGPIYIAIKDAAYRTLTAGEARS